MGEARGNAVISVYSMEEVHTVQHLSDTVGTEYCLFLLEKSSLIFLFLCFLIYPAQLFICNVF